MDHQTKEIINISPSLARKLYRAHQGGRVSLSSEEKKALWRLTGHPVPCLCAGGHSRRRYLSEAYLLYQTHKKGEKG